MCSLYRGDVLWRWLGSDVPLRRLRKLPLPRVREGANGAGVPSLGICTGELRRAEALSRVLKEPGAPGGGSGGGEVCGDTNARPREVLCLETLPSETAA